MPSIIKRRAIDDSGRIGSLYHQYQDRIVGTLKDISNKCDKNPVRKLRFGKASDHENLLEMIGIEDDLRLSILLNLVPRNTLSAIIDYPHPIDQYTRFLHYTYTRKIHRLRDGENKTRGKIQSSNFEADATHFVSRVTWGIELVVVLQLPNVNEVAEQIDTLFHRLRSNLDQMRRISHPVQLTPQEEDLLGQIVDTKVYSNISLLASMKTIGDIYSNIHQLQANNADHKPIEYGLCPIQAVSSVGSNDDSILTIRYQAFTKDTEQYLFQLSNSINYIKSVPIDDVSCFPSVKMKCSSLQNKCIEEIERLKELIIALRRDVNQRSRIDETLNNGQQQQALKQEMDELVSDIKHCQEKKQLINDLQQKHFHFYHVTEENVQTAVKNLMKDDGLDRILCSSDSLNKSEESRFIELRDLLIGEHQNNPNLRLIYADFSNCSFKLPKTICYPKKPQPPAVQGLDDTINLLLLGESGVGKSTFINAFVNYLTFETMKDAESKQAVVLIPVSFIITTGNNFDEQIIKFGEPDETNNEDFDHLGLSVTQRCKSYVFQLNAHGGRKLRIIDTPGFVDTRGLEQDDLNMEHILSYISNLRHVNAICFLLKSNASRLTNFFRTCLRQLYDLFGSETRPNIIFGFTNARTTFYTPGNTAPLLRTVLDSFSDKGIALKKENTFCFDNESFRYLVALRNSIQFSELDRDEYERSWCTSVKESNRLLDYICKDLTVCRVDEESHGSIKRAQMEIMCMIRPILETMRNTLRNIILWNNGEQSKSIGLNPKAIHRPTSITISCKHHAKQLLRFLISSEKPYEELRRDLNCKCISNPKMPVNYILEHKISDHPSCHSLEEMTGQVSSLLNACVELAQFLITTDRCSKEDDLFLLDFKRMINDEEKNCQNNNPTLLNKPLVHELKSRKRKYERQINEFQPNQISVNLPTIYKRIQITRDSPGVREQMAILKQSQQNLMKYYEYEVPDSLPDTTDVYSTRI